MTACVSVNDMASFGCRAATAYNNNVVALSNDNLSVCPPHLELVKYAQTTKVTDIGVLFLFAATCLSARTHMGLLLTACRRRSMIITVDVFSCCQQSTDDGHLLITPNAMGGEWAWRVASRGSACVSRETCHSSRDEASGASAAGRTSWLFEDDVSDERRRITR